MSQKKNSKVLSPVESKEDETTTLLNEVKIDESSSSYAHQDLKPKHKKSNDEDDEAEKSSTALNPLEVKEVLKIIFSHCDLKTLMECRTVSKLWYSEATPAFLRKHFVHIPPILHGLFGAGYLKNIVSVLFLHRTTTNNEAPSKSKKSGSEFINKRKQFKISNIQITDFRDIDIFLSLGLLGNSLKKLIYSASLSIDKLEELLVKNLNHLQWLDFRTSYMAPEDQEDLDLEFCRNLMELLLKPKFKSRPFTLGEINMYHTTEDPKCMEKFQRFAKESTHVRIEKLAFGFHDYTPQPGISITMAQILSKMLERNCMTLQKLRLWSSDVYLHLTNFPILPHLYYIYMSVYPQQPEDRGESAYKFPKDFQISKHLPGLRDIDLYYTNVDSDLEAITGGRGRTKVSQDLWSGYFEKQEPATSVRLLAYSDHGADLTLDPVLRCFSHLEELLLLRPSDFSRPALSVWKWGKNLKIFNIDLVLDDLTSKVSTFDSIFTGFSPETVEKIKNSSSTGFLEQNKDLERLRVNPSIMDLSNLRELTMRLHGNPNKYLPKRILSVAGEFAFKLRPEVIFTFLTDSCNPQSRAVDALKGISDLPNVKIL